jgi:hypothetical protein
MRSMNEPNEALDRPHPMSEGGRQAVEANLPSGLRVQVRSRFDGAWASGFQIFAAQPSGGVLVRRLSDGSVLPVTFAESEVRLDPVPLPARARSSWSPPAIA